VCLDKSFEVEHGTSTVDWESHYTEDGECYHTDWELEEVNSVLDALTLGEPQKRRDMKLYTIECHQGWPLSTWSEPTPLEEILDRYYEQYLDFAEDDLTREQFTAEVFQDLWDCTLIEEGE
jgi:hypothetical protein